ncbi:MAG TPA: carboxypeptidase regulatory-like domain-containing protein, partial [Bryobacteraceae bacterium]|nr:carboxypeptidase regulatory-like domain-containing protein [Bryobacteraceae bacterium]
MSAILWSGLPLAAQVTATISGRIVDASGAGIGGATVTVKSDETGATRTAVTNDQGSYRVDSLPLGPTEFLVEKDGFKPLEQRGIDLVAGQDATVNLKLELGQRTDRVDVVEAIPTVNISTAPISGLVTEQQVKDLPLNGRSLDVLITTNPGAINYSAYKSQQTTTSDGNTFSVAGRRPGDNQFNLNGVEYSGSSQLAVTPGGVSGELLGIDGIREVNVLTDTYGAQYGKRAGAQVQFVTQSGTNTVHGTVFEFLRNSALDARNFFDDNFVPPFRRNQFGGALGGPIRKNKFFLFGNYEGFRQSLAETNVSIVPDDQVRQGLLPNATTGVYAKPANLNPGMLPFMALWPQANGPEITQTNSAGLVVPTGTAYSYSNPKQNINENFGTMRADYRMSDRDSASLFYTVDKGDSFLPQTDPLFSAIERLTSQVASIQQTHIFSGNSLNTLNIGFTRAAFNYDPAQTTNFPAALSFVQGLPPGGISVTGSVTTTGSNVIEAAGPNNASNSWNRRNLFTYADDVQYTRGKHHFSTGVWFQRLRDNENSGSRQLGIATFTGIGNLLAGTVQSFQVIPQANELGWRSWYGAWYAQDEIHLLPRLTVQLGLRHEFTTGWNEVSGRAANYITDASGTLLTDPLVGNSIYTKNNMTKLFSPRASLAWDVFGNGKTAVRAGYGIYYSMIDALNFLMNSLPPWNSSLSFNNQPLLPLLPIVQSAPPPCGPGSKPACVFAPQGLQPDAKALAVNEWNFAIEQEIAHGTSLRVSYVGSFAVHGLLSVDPNTIAPQICATATCVSGGTPGTTKGTVTQGQQYIPLGARPNPNLAAGFFWYTEGNNRYNALQVDVTRRLKRGLELRANYTWSKNLDMNSGLTIAQSNNQPQMVMDPRDPSRDWGPSALNPPQQVTGSFRYQLPFGRNQMWLNSMNPVAEKFLGGWQVNGIVTLLSGFPFTPVIGSNRSGDGDIRNPDRPNVNPSFSGPVVLGNPHQWFDPHAFSLPTIGTWGNEGRGVFSGPGMATADLSLFKNISLTDRTSLQVRAEAFNALNHTNFGPPSPTVFAGPSISPTAGLIRDTATTS